MSIRYRTPVVRSAFKRVVSALTVAALVAGALVVSALAVDGSQDAATAAVPAVTCTTPSAMFNTGYNASTEGQLSGSGAEATDANWMVSGPYGTSTTSGGTTWANVGSQTGWGIQPAPDSTDPDYKPWGAANVITDATKPGPWYQSPYANATWISQEAGSGATQAGPGASWYYKYDFSLDEQLASNFLLDLDFFADNSVAEVYVNGIAQSANASNAGKLPQGGSSANPVTYRGFEGGNQSSIRLDNGWVSGENSIVVQIFSAPGQEGFLTQAHSPASCSYTVAKSVDEATPRVGDTVTYSVTVSNTGSVSLPYSGMTESAFVDDLTAVLDDATYNNDASAGATYDSTTKQLTWNGPLAGGATQVITYSVTVTAGGDGSIENSVSVPSSNAIYSSSCSALCTVTSSVRNTVDAVDDGPVSVNAGSTVTTNVRANDTSATGVTLASPVLPSATSAQGNSLSLVSGQIRYSARAGFSGADSYTYTLCDTGTPTPVCDSAPATVSIVVNNVFSNGPSATGTSTPQNTAKTFELSSLVSVSGSAPDPAAVTQLTAPSHGAITISTVDGSVVYTPSSGYAGPDSFQLTVCDQSAPTQCRAVTVSLSVGVNDVSANADTQSVLAGGSVTTNVVAGDSSGGVADTTASGTALNPAIAIVTAPAHGTATPNGDGTVTYEPNVGFSGTDSYSYQVCDTSSPTSVCATGAVTVTVRNGFITPDGPGAPSAPDASGGTGEASAVTPQNTPRVFPLANLITVLGAPIDPTTIEQVGTTPHGGTLAINTATGQVSYTPAAGYAGPDSFTLTMCDTATPQACYSVETAVTVGPNIVLASDDDEVVPFDKPLAIDLMSNDITQTGQALDPLSIVILTDPAHGTVTVPTLSAGGSSRIGGSGAAVAAGTPGSVVYTPRAGYVGTDSFRYRICDTSVPTAVCSTATVSITVSNPTLALTGSQGAVILLLTGIAALVAGTVLLLVRRPRRRVGSHRAA